MIMDDFAFARYKEIQAMPDGPAKDEAIEALTREYPELTTTLRDDISAAEKLIDTEMPTSRVAGPRSNPFAVEIANPFGSAAAGYKQHKGYKERGERREELDKLHAAQSATRGDVIRAGINDPEMMKRQADFMRMTPEQRRLKEEEDRLWGA